MLWIIFWVAIIGMLALDLGVFNKKAHTIKLSEAVFQSIIWIAAALLFAVGIYFSKGKGPSMLFISGYVLEKSLSVDNLFVFLMIFKYFRVEDKYQHKVLFWGILVALFLRALFIGLGVAIINLFHPIIYIFGAFLIYTGIKMVKEQDEEFDPDANPIFRWMRKSLRLHNEFVQDHFFIVKEGKKWCTMLFFVLMVINVADLIFAVDSIPAVLAISQDPFIVYTSNIFAILGLRALYFVLAGIMRMFRHLHYGLALILVLVGVKMMVSKWYHPTEGMVLGTIGLILALSIIASLIQNKIDERRALAKPDK